MRARSSGKLVTQAAYIAVFAVFVTLAGALISAASARRGTSREEFENCPSHAPAGVARNAWSPAKRLLAPREARPINLCRYASGRTGLDSLKLAGNDLVTSQSIQRQLIHKFDALKSYQGPPFHCPADRGDEVLATLYYRWHKVRIIVSLTGCPSATNGDLRRAAFNFDGKNPAGPRLLHQLKRLTRRLHFAV